MKQSTKIFGIGLSRTGTTTLTRVLNAHGIKTIHLPKNMEQIAAFTAATDITVSCRYKDLDKAYPGSKFILTVRDKQSWLQSCKDHYLRVYYKGIYEDSPLIEQEFALEAEQLCYHRPYELGRYNFDSEQFSQAYDKHYQEAVEYFGDRLLILDICGGDSVSKLTDFIGVTNRYSNFPIVNKHVGLAPFLFHLHRKKLASQASQMLRNLIRPLRRKKSQ